MNSPMNVGVLAALNAAVLAIIKTHPDPDALGAALHTEGEVVTAALLGRNTPEAALEALRQTIEVLRSRLER